MKRPIKFKRVFQHSETGIICMTSWGNVTHKDEDCTDWSSFKSPSQISGYYPIADIQFTGLKDSNGKEIYEGDIIESDNPNYGYGNSDEPDCLYITIESIIDFYDDEYLMRKCESGEVIGNIYENPKLINNP